MKVEATIAPKKKAKVTLNEQELSHLLAELDWLNVEDYKPTEIPYLSKLANCLKEIECQ